MTELTIHTPLTSGASPTMDAVLVPAAKQVPTQVAASEMPVKSARQSAPELDSTNAKPDTGLFNALLAGQADGELSLGAVLKLLIELGQQNWQANVETRNSELNAQVASIETQAAKMREASVLSMVMGVVFGAIGIVGGIINIAGSIKSFNSQKKLDTSSGIKEQQANLQDSKTSLEKFNNKVVSNQNKAESTLDMVAMEKYHGKARAYETQAIDTKGKINSGELELKQAQANFETDLKLVDKSAAKWKATGDSIGGFSKLGEGVGQSGAQFMQADNKLEEAKQADFQAGMQQANDFIQHYNSMIRDIRNLIAQINQDTNQTVRSVINKA